MKELYKILLVDDEEEYNKKDKPGGRRILVVGDAKNGVEALK